MGACCCVMCLVPLCVVMARISRGLGPRTPPLFCRSPLSQRLFPVSLALPCLMSLASLPLSRSTPPFTSHKKPNSSFYQYTAHPLAPTTHSQLPTPPSRQRRRAGCVDEPSSGRQAK